MNTAVDAVRPLVEERNHQLIVSIRRGLRVDADPTRLEQILVNLLTNAAKYTESEGTIWVHACKEDGEVVIRVARYWDRYPAREVASDVPTLVQGDRSRHAPKADLASV